MDERDEGKDEAPPLPEMVDLNRANVDLRIILTEEQYKAFVGVVQSGRGEEVLLPVYVGENEPIYIALGVQGTVVQSTENGTDVSDNDEGNSLEEGGRALAAVGQGVDWERIEDAKVAENAVGANGHENNGDDDGKIASNGKVDCLNLRDMQDGGNGSYDNVELRIPHELVNERNGVGVDLQNMTSVTTSASHSEMVSSSENGTVSVPLASRSELVEDGEGEVSHDHKIPDKMERRDAGHEEVGNSLDEAASGHDATVSHSKLYASLKLAGEVLEWIGNETQQLSKYLRDRGYLEKVLDIITNLGKIKGKLHELAIANKNLCKVKERNRLSQIKVEALEERIESLITSHDQEMTGRITAEEDLQAVKEEAQKLREKLQSAEIALSVRKYVGEVPSDPGRVGHDLMEMGSDQRPPDQEPFGDATSQVGSCLNLMMIPHNDANPANLGDDGKAPEPPRDNSSGAQSAHEEVSSVGILKPCYVRIQRLESNHPHLFPTHVESDDDVTVAAHADCPSQSWDRSSSGSRPKKCPTCHKYVMYKNFNRHFKLHGGPAQQPLPLECHVCNKSFSRSDSLKKHLLIHRRRRKTFTCSICKYKFTTVSNLKVHIDSVHKQIRQVKCPKCPMRFRFKCDLNVHDMNVHLKLKPFTCEMCDKKFGRRTHLLRHQRLHSGEFPYSCDSCGDKFLRKESLERHLQLHRNGEKPCSLCGKLYYSANGRRKHDQRLCPKQT